MICNSEEKSVDSGKKGRSVAGHLRGPVLHYLELAGESILIVVGHLELEAAHAASVVHDQAVLVGFGRRTEGVANIAIELARRHLLICVLARVEVVRPVVSGDIRCEPGDARVREGEDVASISNFVLVASEEVDVAA